MANPCVRFLFAVTLIVLLNFFLFTLIKLLRSSSIYYNFTYYRWITPAYATKICRKSHANQKSHAGKDGPLGQTVDLCIVRVWYLWRLGTESDRVPCDYEDKAAAQEHTDQAPPLPSVWFSVTSMLWFLVIQSMQSVRTNQNVMRHINLVRKQNSFAQFLWLWIRYCWPYDCSACPELILKISVNWAS